MTDDPRVAHLAEKLEGVQVGTTTLGKITQHATRVWIARYLIEKGAWWLPDPKDLGWDDWGNRTMDRDDYDKMLARNKEMLGC